MRYYLNLNLNWERNNERSKLDNSNLLNEKCVIFYDSYGCLWYRKPKVFDLILEVPLTILACILVTALIEFQCID